MAFLAIYITNPDKTTATAVGQHLLDKKLVACVNIHAITSAYWWHGIQEHGDEVVALVKTTQQNWEAVQREVERIHPYDVPCIMKIEVEANAAYEKWIQEQVA